MKYLEKYGSKTSDRQSSGRLADQIMELKLAPKLFDALVRNLRDVVSIIRSQERLVMQICVRDAGMPRKDFLSSFPKSETDFTGSTSTFVPSASTRRFLPSSRTTFCGHNES